MKDDNQFPNLPDAGFILGGASALNSSLNERAEAHRAYLAQIEAEWCEVFTTGAQWLEEQCPFVENGTAFEGMTPQERAFHTSELLGILRGQHEWVSNFEQETANAAAPCLVAALGKMIGILEQQSKRGSALLLVPQDNLRNIVSSGPRSSRSLGKTLVERIASGQSRAM